MTLRRKNVALNALVTLTVPQARNVSTTWMRRCVKPPAAVDLRQGVARIDAGLAMTLRRKNVVLNALVTLTVPQARNVSTTWMRRCVKPPAAVDLRQVVARIDAGLVMT